MLELPNLLVTSWTEIMMSLSLFQNTFILKRPRAANFADIIKTATIFIKTTFKDPPPQNLKN